jgi:hypothetical protein
MISVKAIIPPCPRSALAESGRVGMTDPSNSLQRSSEEQESKAMGLCADQCAGAKEGKCGEHEWLPSEDMGEAGKCWLEDGAREEE